MLVRRRPYSQPVGGGVDQPTCSCSTTPLSCTGSGYALAGPGRITMWKPRDGPAAASSTTPPCSRLASFVGTIGLPPLGPSAATVRCRLKSLQPLRIAFGSGARGLGFLGKNLFTLLGSICNITTLELWKFTYPSVRVSFFIHT